MNFILYDLGLFTFAPDALLRSVVEAVEDGARTWCRDVRPDLDIRSSHPCKIPAPFSKVRVMQQKRLGTVGSPALARIWPPVRWRSTCSLEVTRGSEWKTRLPDS